MVLMLPLSQPQYKNALEKEVSINNFCCSIIIFVKHNTIRNKKVYICFKQYFTKQRDSFFHLENNMFRYTLHFTWYIMLVIKHDKLKLFQSWHSVFSRHFLNSTRLFSDILSFPNKNKIILSSRL